ncbi:tetratricopeptide repeat protein [Poriferisphaera corsica]|uniref:Tetratricopeptide repeat protein n=1 Tax=Poriferisphaera corsica TaxID=2528020 RepID=A0A517YYA7_9BACT|nr:tetratricopeptide repeat protein [Poriferisphaera corsica]QDU35199.1 tetratricopeptide repeat protein [Poriferisphaera corsica]
MKIRNQRQINVYALFVGLLLICGCEAGNNKTHKQWVGEANDRWHEMRSGMMLQMATQQFETGDLDIAAKTINEAMRIDQKNDGLSLLAGRVSLEKGQLERAYHWFNHTVDLNDKNADAYYYRGVVQQRWKQYDEAELSYKQAYDSQRDNPSYLLALSEMIVQQDRVDEAAELLEGKLVYFDQVAGLRSTLGHIYRLKRDHNEAAWYFEKASMLDPENMKLIEEVAVSQISAKKYSKSIHTLDMLLRNESYKDRTDIKRLLAESYYQSGRYEQSRQAYLDLTRMREVKAGDWVKLGDIAWMKGDLGGSLTAATRVMKMDPERHDGYLLAGMVWQKRGELERALKNFDRAAELAPGDAVPCILRGISLQRTGRTSAAIAAYEEALRRKPRDERALKLLQTLVPTGY